MKPLLWLISRCSLKLGIVTASLVVAFLATGILGAENPRPPDLVLVVVIDTLRADHLPAYGYSRPTTPHLDALLSHGTVFDQSYSAATETRPSVASILTGLRPSVHGFWNERHDPLVTQPNLAQLLRRYGYYTININANPNTTQFAPDFDYSWSEYDTAHSRYHPAAFVVRQAENALQNAPQGKRIFCYLQLTDPHEPYDPPEYDPSFFTGDAIGRNFDSKFAGIRASNAAQVTPPILSNMINRYDAAIHYMDGVLTPFLASLMQRHPNHLVIFTADHGEGFLEHGEAGHGSALYNTVVRVPMIVFDSASEPQRRRVPELVSGLDILPTILDRIGGIPQPPRAAGRSFLNLLRKSAGRELVRWLHDLVSDSSRVALSEILYSTGGRKDDGRCFGMALFFQPHPETDSMILVKLDSRGVGCREIHESKVHRTEWYDVGTDPGERHRLRPREAHANAVGPILDKLWPLGSVAAVGPNRKIGKEEERMLRALGYLQ